jgi:hypothetical protein
MDRHNPLQFQQFALAQRQVDLLKAQALEELSLDD